MKKYFPFRIGKETISFLVDKKALIYTSILLLIALIVFAISTSVGEVLISPIETILTLFGMGNEMNEMIIYSFRLPRIIMALLAGICLAIAGGILQNLVRNPLSSPDIIGVTGGASVSVMLFLTTFSDSNHSLQVSIQWLPVSAFIGGVITVGVVYFLSWKKGVSSFRIILVGIGLSMLTKSLTTLLMIKGPIYNAAQANVWITGSVSTASWEQVQILLPLTIMMIGITLIMTRNVNIQDFGDDIATGVGSHVQKNRLILLFLSTALTACAVSFVGGIGFVGLMAPHIARRLVGSSFGVVLPTSSLIGGLLVMLADLIGRTILLPLEVPAGVFTAAIGAPYFIYLLYKSRNS